MRDPTAACMLIENWRYGGIAACSSEVGALDIAQCDKSEGYKSEGDKSEDDKSEDDKSEERDHNRVQAVERACDLLLALGSFGLSGAHITELSSLCGLKLSTCHRLLLTLFGKGFVSRHSSSGKYCLGAVAVGLGGISELRSHSERLRAFMRPFISELACKTGETVNVAVLEGPCVIYIDQVETPSSPKLRMFARTGSKGPAYCTGTGKALLAGLPDEVLINLVEDMEFVKFTSETIDDAQKLMMEIQRIRAEGYSLDMGERDVGVRCVAAPVHDAFGATICAISVSGPSSNMTNFYLQHELISLVCSTAQHASQRFAANPFV